MYKARSIVLAVKKADANSQEVHLSLRTVFKRHRHHRDKMYQVFMKLLKPYNEHSSFCVRVSDPNNPLIKISRFFAIIKGPKTLVKFNLLNHPLILFVSRYKMKRVACGLDLRQPFTYEFQSTT